MSKLLAASFVATMMAVGYSGTALADHGEHEHGGGGGHSAPEPLTVIGLAIGAGGIGVARWAAKRKAPPKP
jgi:hypothetical protein